MRIRNRDINIGTRGVSTSRRRAPLLTSVLPFIALLSIPQQSASAESNGASDGSVIIEHLSSGGINPVSETRTLPEGESLLIAGGRSYSNNELEFLADHRGDEKVEISNADESGSAAVIVELREQPLASIYSQMLQLHNHTGPGVQAFSVQESQILLEQRTRTLEEQDFVLNRLGQLNAGNPSTIKGGNTPGIQGTSSDNIKRFITAVNAIVLHNESVESLRKAVANDPELAKKVSRIVPNQPVYASLDTSVPLISAPEVWKRLSPVGHTLDGTGVRIGIVDTGIDYEHPDLGGCFGPGCKVAGGYDFVNSDSNPMDDHGHGTHCAAIAAGNGVFVDGAGNQNPVRGVAPGATLYAYKVLNGSGSGFSSDIIGALERCLDPDLDGNLSDHLDVCSLSLGGSGDPDDILSRSVDNTTKAGVVVVVAAGNAGPYPRTIASPGTSRLAITVAASCKPNDTGQYCTDGPIAKFSSRGPIPDFSDVHKPDIAAPGVNICAARARSTYESRARCLGDNHVALSGTSMATPHVAGVAALLKQASPSAPPEIVKSVIMSSAIDLNLPETIQGAGLINALSALKSLGIAENVAHISNAPIKFAIDPTTSIVKASAEVTITNKSINSLEFMPTFSCSQDGVTGVVSPASRLLQPQESAQFTLTVVVDVTKIPSQKTVRGKLNFATQLGDATASVYVEILDRLTTDIATINLGLKNGFELVWKDSATLRLTNKLSDLSSSYQVSTSCCSSSIGSGLADIRVSAGSSSIKIAPRSTIDLPITFEAVGRDFPNGSYEGAITISSPMQTIKIPFSFYKGWELAFTYESAETSAPYLTILSNGKISESAYPQKDRRKRFWVPEPGPWHQATYFSGAEIIFTDNLSTPKTVNDFVVRASDARQRLKIESPMTADKGRSGRVQVTSIFNTLSKTSFVWWGSGQDGYSRRLMINDFPSNIVVGSSTTIFNDSTIFAWQHALVGDSRLTDVVLTGEDSFTTKFLSLPSNRNTDKTTSVIAANCLLGQLCVWDSKAFATVKSGNVATFQVSSNHYLTPDDAVFRYMPAHRLRVDSLLDTYIESNIVASKSGVFSVVAGAPFTPFENYPHPAGDTWDQITPAGLGSSIGLGAGPRAHVGTWYSYPQFRSWYISRFGWSSWYLGAGGATDYTPGQEVNYTLLRDQQPYLSGTTAALKCLFFMPTLPPGNYQLKLEYQYPIDGFSTLSTAEGTFESVSLEQHRARPVDQHPPTLRNLMLVSNGLIQNALDPTLTNYLYFTLDPRPGLLRPLPSSWVLHEIMPDELVSVTLEESLDGVEWAP